jgi:prepilin-type N-terminal cleavage/methylation domain-containing protein
VRRLTRKCGTFRPPTSGIPHRRGFTLIETALATIIVGVGVLALVESQQAFIRANAWSTHSATATYLANEIREMTRRMPRHDPVTGLYSQTVNGAATLRGWGPEAGESTVADFDDIDDFDGITFSFNGTDGLGDSDLPGPIDAFSEIIPQINNDGTAALDSDGNPLPLQGWSQSVRVEKVMPTNYSTVVAHDAVLAADNTGFTGLPVDQFPLRVIVTVSFRGVFDSEAQPVAVVTWIVP